MYSIIVVYNMKPYHILQSMHSASRVKLFEYRHAKFSNRTQMYYGLKQTNKHKQGCCLQH